MSSFDRKRSLFDGSRLYRQSSDTASELLNTFLSEDEWFKTAIRDITSGGSVIEINGLESAENLLNEVRSALVFDARTLSPYHAIPALVDLATKVYSGQQSDVIPKTLGLVAKTCLAAIWHHVFVSSGNSSARDQLTDLLRKALLFQQVKEVRNGMILSPMSRARVQKSGVVADDANLARILEDFSIAFAPGGKMQRLASQTAQTALANPREFLSATVEVMCGKSPGNVDTFRGSFFGQIAREPTEFWAGIHARLLLSVAAFMARNHVTDENVGVAIVGRSCLGSSEIPRQCATLIQNALRECFWQRSWFTSQNVDLWPALIVKRPALRIVSNQELFATSATMIADSITSWVETCIMRDRDTGPAVLSNDHFRRIVSQPFEEEALAVFRELGFRAGGVNERGIWQTDGGPVNLREFTDCNPPGEIDLVAVHDRGYVIVGECKVLSMPLVHTQLRNLAQKIGELDSEGFHSKLLKKKHWIDAIGASLTPSYSGLMAFLILDRKWPGKAPAGETIVCDLESLREGVEQLLNDEST